MMQCSMISRGGSPGQRFCRLAVVMVMLVMAGCSGEEPAENRSVAQAPPAVVLPAEPEYSSLAAEDAHALLARQPQTMVVDVRTQAEISWGRIPGSVPVAFEAILAGRAELPRDRPLLVVCAVGGRSYAAGLYLARQGYPLVYNLRGGMASWARSGLPLVRTSP